LSGFSYFHQEVYLKSEKAVLRSMRRHLPFFTLLTALAALAGWLLSHLSLVGRVGISVAYREYQFLKTWWMGAGLVLGVWLAVYWMHSIAQRRFPRARIQHATTLFIALVGLHATYADFRGSISHRWLGERFHLGAYLFWIGVMVISVRFLTARKTLPPIA
jgi:hypothetical protein